MHCSSADQPKHSISEQPAGNDFRSAVTMIELMIVLLILAIAAAAATPRLSGAIHSYRLQSATKRVLLDLELARSHARTSGRDITVRFDSEHDRYTISDIRSLDQPDQSYAVDLGATPYLCRIVHARFRDSLEEFDEGSIDGVQTNEISEGDSEVVFDRFELPNRGGTIILKCGTLTAAILVDANSGEAKSQ